MSARTAALPAQAPSPSPAGCSQSPRQRPEGHGQDRGRDRSQAPGPGRGPGHRLLLLDRSGRSIHRCRRWGGRGDRDFDSGGMHVDGDEPGVLDRVESPANGSGTGTVTFTVAANTASARTGTLTIAEETFTVNQASAGCTYSIDPTEQAIDEKGGPITSMSRQVRAAIGRRQATIRGSQSPKERRAAAMAQSGSTWGPLAARNEPVR